MKREAVKGKDVTEAGHIRFSEHKDYKKKGGGDQVNKRRINMEMEHGGTDLKTEQAEGEEEINT